MATFKTDTFSGSLLDPVWNTAGDGTVTVSSGHLNITTASYKYVYQTSITGEFDLVARLKCPFYPSIIPDASYGNRFFARVNTLNGCYGYQNRLSGSTTQNEAKIFNEIADYPYGINPAISPMEYICIRIKRDASNDFYTYYNTVSDGSGSWVEAEPSSRLNYSGGVQIGFYVVAPVSTTYQIDYVNNYGGTSVDFLAGDYSRWVGYLKAPAAAILSLVGAIEYVLAELSVYSRGGSATPEGSTLYQVGRPKNKGGALSLSGLYSRFRSFLRIPSGTLSPTGRVWRTNAIVSHLYDGTLSLSGVLNKAFHRTYDGVLDFVGTASSGFKLAYYYASGALGLAGSILRNIITVKSLSGSITPNGQLTGVSHGVPTTQYIYDESGNVIEDESGEPIEQEQVVTTNYVTKIGSITPSGILSTMQHAIERAISGVLTPIGRITIVEPVLDRISAASLTISGLLSYIASVLKASLIAGITISGSLSYRIFHPVSKSGVLSLAGDIAGVLSGLRFASKSGVLSFAGNFSRLFGYVRTKNGHITPSAILTRITTLWRTQTSSISFAGSIEGIWNSGDWNLGILTFAGQVTRGILPFVNSKSSILGFSGSVTSQRQGVERTLTGEVSFSGEDILWREALYYGPEVFTG